MDWRHNLEIKAEIANWEATRHAVRQLATERLGHQRQIDTYFHCRQGRLKLREIQGKVSQLIWYERPDVEGPKTSRYQLVEVGEAAPLRNLLATAWGIRGTVRKSREIYLYQQVRIHLDRVEELGFSLNWKPSWMRGEIGMKPDNSSRS
jgi:adenylate cyclase class IV